MYNVDTIFTVCKLLNSSKFQLTEEDQSLMLVD